MGFNLVPPAYPTRVWIIPGAHPKSASGNQNQLIPKEAISVAGSEVFDGMVLADLNTCTNVDESIH